MTLAEGRLGGAQIVCGAQKALDLDGRWFGIGGQSETGNFTCMDRA
jgi:hypothetical protein